MRNALAILSLALATGALMTGCGGEKEVEGGILVDMNQQKAIIETDEYDQALVLAAVEALELHEEYSPENFEAKQRAYIAQTTPMSQQPALTYLPTRVAQVTQDGASQTVEADLESSKLKKIQVGDAIRTQVIIESDNTYKTKDKDFGESRMEYTINMLVYDMDDIQIQTIGVKRAE